MSTYCDEMADVWNERRVRARKDHQCDACKLTIRRGDHYIRDAMLYEGSWNVVLRCERCELIFDHLQGMMTNSDEFCDRELNCGHEFTEHWGEEPPAWLASLAFWIPGDPLPATNPCTHLSTWRSQPKWYAQACGNNVSRYSGHGIRSNREPSHTEVCS